MIGFLRGRLVVKRPPHLMIDVNGVGYELDAPMSTFYGLPEVGEEVALHTHLVVREDAHTLFGFATETDRKLFRTLIKISGVGAKLALTILSGISVEGFLRCVEEEDSATLVQLPGVGKKTAARLIVEMRDRIKAEELLSSSTGKPGVVVSQGSQGEAFGALVALGYKPAEVTRMLKGLDSENLATEELIRQALQNTLKR